MRLFDPALVITLSLATAACASTSPQSARSGAQAGVAMVVDVPAISRPAGETSAWWFRNGAAQAAARGAMAGRAKNVILFVGDGMSLTTVAAARILEGQRKGGPGEDHGLSWEAFNATALSRTYNTDAQTPDSAGTATAMTTGVKTRTGVVGIGPEAARSNCAQGLATPVLTLWELASASGMATGVVTTTRVTHATPAAAYSHSADRNWESDANLTDAAKAEGCKDIASQLIEAPDGRGPDVVMGGGRKYFLPEDQRDPEYPDITGKRRDGRNLITEWQQRHPRGRYVWNARQLATAPGDQPLLALFEPDHMQYEHDRAQDPAGEPSLAEMTRTAINHLTGNPNGFVLMVEAGRIDHAHHAGNAYRALDETIALSDAVRAATELTSTNDTLILVTADHSHTLGFVGYPGRGNPILGKVMGSNTEDGEPGKLARDATGLPYTTLNYINGPGYVGASARQPEGSKSFEHDPRDYQAARNGRPDLTSVDTQAPHYLQEALFPARSETHGGDDVGIWASGPGSNAVRGSVEQNTIFHFLLQSTPRLRAAVCARSVCDANGVPVMLPSVVDFRPD